MSPDAGDDGVRLADSLAVVVQALGRRPGDAPADGRGTVNVFRCWDDVVGRPICEHARPVALDAGRLVVEVDQPGWATQLRFLSATLMARLTEVVGADVVRAIDVRVGRH